jgi:hypothetical protein
MAIFSRLHHLYSFPGFAPLATVRGVFGDPFAVVLALRRRRKKLPAACAALHIAASTINRSDKYATSIVAVGAFSSNSPSAESTAATATP